MSDFLPGPIVLAIGGSIAPPLLLLTILFFSSQRPLPNAGALAVSMRLCRNKPRPCLGPCMEGRNNRAITVALCFVFGTFFVLRGLLVA
jgi:hypothetical protein